VGTDRHNANATTWPHNQHHSSSSHVSQIKTDQIIPSQNTDDGMRPKVMVIQGILSPSKNWRDPQNKTDVIVKYL